MVSPQTCRQISDKKYFIIAMPDELCLLKDTATDHTDVWVYKNVLFLTSGIVFFTLDLADNSFSTERTC